MRLIVIFFFILTLNSLGIQFPSVPQNECESTASSPTFCKRLSLVYLPLSIEYTIELTHLIVWAQCFLSDPVSLAVIKLFQFSILCKGHCLLPVIFF